MERKGLDSRGKRGKVEIPQAQPRKLDFLPAGKQVPAAERNGPVFMQSSVKCQPRSAFLYVQLRRVAPRGHKSKAPKRHRTPFWCLRLMLVGAERPASAFLHVQLRRVEARGHKAKKPKRPRTPFRLLRLMLVASERPASAFLGIFLLYNGRLMGRVFLE